ncbi:unnamed protein product [Victoria cruziana]
MGMAHGSLNGTSLFLYKKTVESCLGQSRAVSRDKLIDWVYDQMMKDSAQEKMDLERVRIAILSVLSVVNSCMPGMQHHPPSQKEVKNFYDCCTNLDKEEKKQKLKIFIAGLLEKRKLNQYTEITSVVAPPLAMIMKRMGEQSPQLKMIIEIIPDVTFVPLFTIGALIIVKMVQKNALKQIMEAFSPIDFGGASP